MKYIKRFEEINQTDMPKVGDYLMDKNEPNRIGKIYQHSKFDNYYSVEYLDKDLVYFVDDNSVLYWSPNKEELEPYLTSNKYNL